MRQSTVEQWKGARRVERWLEWPGERSPRWEGLKSRAQATAFPFVVAGFERNQWLPWARGRFSATVIPSLLRNLGRRGGSHGWRVNFQQRLFLPLWLTLRWTSGLQRRQSSSRQRYFPSLLLALSRI